MPININSYTELFTALCIIAIGIAAIIVCETFLLLSNILKIKERLDNETVHYYPECDKLQHIRIAKITETRCINSKKNCRTLTLPVAIRVCEECETEIFDRQLKEEADFVFNEKFKEQPYTED